MSRRIGTVVRGWFDRSSFDADLASQRQIDWKRNLPFIGMHLACFGVIWVGWSWFAVGVALFLYAIRVLALTAFYHRYFSHRTFKTSRAMQAIFAFIGAAAVQRGPMWWAAHHRHHHGHTDEPEDTHSPRQDGFFWSHMGWFLAPLNFPTRHERVRDLARYPELRFLDRYDIVVPVSLAVGLFVLGEVLERWAPGLGTGGWQLLVWGFFISTVAVYHVTFAVNSFGHIAGTRRYPTPDDSRNNPLIALLTFGEGWHNNHHHYPKAAHQGFYWWEIDITWYVLRLFERLGLVWDVKRVPTEVREVRGEVEAAA